MTICRAGDRRPGIEERRYVRDPGAIADIAILA